MQGILRQSTATTVKLGPFYSATDGSALTGLSIPASNVRLSKNGGNITQKNDATACSHDELSLYDCALNTTDTGTVGRLQIYVSASGGFVVPHDFVVLPAAVYDSIIAGTDYLDVYVTNKTGYSLTNDQSTVTIGTVTTLTNKSDFALSSAGVAAILQKPVTGYSVGTLGYTLELVRKILTNKWAYSGTTFTIYDDNATSALKQFTLDSATTPTSRTPV